MTLSDNVYRPRGLGNEGRKLWESVVSTYDLMPHESRLLGQACRVADVVADLDAVVAAEGVMGSDGRAHPAVVEGRQQRLALARLLVALRLPDVDSGDRPQHRGMRGPYPFRVAR